MGPVPGHKATLREEPLNIGGTQHTHDWEVWVKGIDGNRIENYVEKVRRLLELIFSKLYSIIFGNSVNKKNARLF